MNRLKKGERSFGQNDVEQYLKGLLPELNLRLFIEAYGAENLKTEKGMKAEPGLLWIEGIELISYEERRIKRRTFNRLMGKRAGEATAP